MPRTDQSRLIRHCYGPIPKIATCFATTIYSSIPIQNQLFYSNLKNKLVTAKAPPTEPFTAKGFAIDFEPPPISIFIVGRKF
jgi:hypothetical protein